MSLLRTDEMTKKYEDYRKSSTFSICTLCTKETLQVFKHWKIMDNAFPYDKIAQTHHMILPNRHVIEDDLNGEELEEFRKIKDDILHKNYDFIFEPTYKNKSIPGHFHLHLIVIK